MGAVGYPSTVADRDYFAAQRAIEEAAVEDDTDPEWREVSELYRRKGLSGQLLDEVLETITANLDRWVGTILEEGRHCQPVAKQRRTTQFGCHHRGHPDRSPHPAITVRLAAP
jgi:hypothetical protein